MNKEIAFNIEKTPVSELRKELVTFGILSKEKVAKFSDKEIEQFYLDAGDIIHEALYDAEHGWPWRAE